MRSLGIARSEKTRGDDLEVDRATSAIGSRGLRFVGLGWLRIGVDVQSSKGRSDFAGVDRGIRHFDRIYVREVWGLRVAVLGVLEKYCA